MFREGHPVLVKVNQFLLQIQYTLFMMVFFIIFIIASLILILPAWIIGIIDKFKNLPNMTSGTEKIMNLGIFIPFGLIILVLDMIIDLNYFW